MSDIKRIAIFASGSGSNAENIVNFFKAAPEIEIVSILTNKKDAFVVERAKKLNIPCIIFNRDDFYKTENIVAKLKNMKCDLIILAGFLWLVPPSFVSQFPNKIINIHPALLPKYGGKGMYGENVHKAVVENNENFSGITIHFVNEQYDQGDIIFQATCDVLPTDSADDVANKVHALEYKHFPKVINDIIELL